MTNQATEAVTISLSRNKRRFNRQQKEKRGIPRMFNV